MENRRKIEPKEIPSRLIPRLLAVFTRQLEILVTIVNIKREVREGRWEEGKGYFSSLSSLARFLFSLSTASLRHKKELQQRRRRRLRERRLKSEAQLLQTLSRLFHLVQFIKCWQFVLELNSKGLYQSSGKEKESLHCVHVLHKT